MKLVRRLLAAVVVLNALLVGAAVFVRRLVPRFGDESSETFSLVAAMDGVELVSRANPFKGGSITSYLGGADVDLTGAVIDGEAHLEIRAVLGGAAIRVPAGWRVEVMRNVVGGEVVNATEPDAGGDDAPLLLVTANVVFGGVLIAVPSEERSEAQA